MFLDWFQSFLTSANNYAKTREWVFHSDRIKQHCGGLQTWSPVSCPLLAAAAAVVPMWRMFHGTALGSFEPSQSPDRRTEIRRHIKMVMEQLEEVLAELKDVAKELREVKHTLACLLWRLREWFVRRHSLMGRSRKWKVGGFNPRMSWRTNVLQNLAPTYPKPTCLEVLDLLVQVSSIRIANHCRMVGLQEQDWTSL